MISLPAPNSSFPTSITCSVSTLLLSASLLIIVTAIITLLVQKLSRWLNRSSCSQNDDLCAKSKCPTILKRDSWYRIIIFVIVLAFIFTNLFVDNKDALNYFSFASTIASIILSVVAIMMTIFSDAKNENTKAQINRAVQQLEAYHEQISKTENTIQDVHNKIQDLAKRIGHMQEDIETVKHGYEQTTINLEELNAKQNSERNEVTANEDLFG